VEEVLREAGEKEGYLQCCSAIAIGMCYYTKLCPIKPKKRTGLE